MALLHDIGDTLGAYNTRTYRGGHPQALLDARLHWITGSTHLPGLFFFHYIGSTATCASVPRPSPFRGCRAVCELYDQSAFDPDYDSAPRTSSNRWSAAVRGHRSARSTLALQNRAKGPHGEFCVSRRAWRRTAVARGVPVWARRRRWWPPPPRVAGHRAILATPDAADIHSFAPGPGRRGCITCRSTSPSFRRQAVGGTATLDIDRQPAAKQVILDSRGWQSRRLPTHPASRCNISRGERRDSGRAAAIALRPDTRRSSSATERAGRRGAAMAGRRADRGQAAAHLFSQGHDPQPTWIPTRIRPACAIGWDATIRVPAGLTAVMSAPRSAETEPRRRKRLQIPHGEHVPTYLIAIAVGDLKFQSLGRRSGVWTEPPCWARRRPSSPTPTR